MDGVPRLVARLETLPGFRKVLVDESVTLDYDRGLEALRELDAVEEFARAVAALDERS